MVEIQFIKNGKLIKYIRSEQGEANRILSLKSPEAREKMSKSKKGGTPKNFTDIQKLAWAANKDTPSWNTGLIGYQAGKSHWSFGKKREEITGENHWSWGKKRADITGKNNKKWKGGITPDMMKIRNSHEYKIWRKSVFKRDAYTCQKCLNRGGYIVSHHINNFSEREDLRTYIANGITLCKMCHLEFHIEYGKSNNTHQQICDFILNGFLKTG